MLSPATSTSSFRGPAPACLCTVQGCWQICLDSLLQSNATEAREFLQDGCQLLRTALGLEALLLTSVMANPATNLAGGSAETAIYWWVAYWAKAGCY